MPSETLLEVLMRRDGMTRREAQAAIQEARACMWEDGNDPESILEDFFGLEPDYIFDLLEDA